MPRYLFPAGNTGVTGAQRYLRFYRNATTVKPETDMRTSAAGAEGDTGIANGVITQDATGAYPAFVGPDDRSSLWYEIEGVAEIALAKTKALDPATTRLRQGATA